MISDYLYSLKRENIENLALDQNFSVKFASLLKSSQWEPYLINRFEDSNIVDSIKFLWSTVEAAYKKHQLTLERNIALEDKAACQQRSSNLWECFARKKTEYGYIYKFKLKSEYNHNRITTESLARKITECIERKKLEIYPAAEPNAKQAVDWLNLEQLKHLGYKYYFDQESNLIIDLPDRETFINLYETLRESFPDLPKFEVFSSEGIAGDEDFSTANYRGTVLSSGQEFVHDHFYHLIRRLKRIFDGLASYQKTEYAIVHAINLIHHKIKWVLSDQVKCPKVDQVFKENLHNVEKIYSVLGMAADALSSQPTDSILNSDFTYDYSAQFVKNLGNSKWKPYLIRRFKDPNIVDSIQELWAIVEEACNA